MNAAIYARKSTDQAGAGDKSESVERQLTHARFAGWVLDDARLRVKTKAPKAHSSGALARYLIAPTVKPEMKRSRKRL
jgi:hypothetical protein